MAASQLFIHCLLCCMSSAYGMIVCSLDASGTPVDRLVESLSKTKTVSGDRPVIPRRLLHSGDHTSSNAPSSPFLSPSVSPSVSPLVSPPVSASVSPSVSPLSSDVVSSSAECIGPLCVNRGLEVYHGLCSSCRDVLVRTNHSQPQQHQDWTSEQGSS